jgi:hypothetical protein
MRKHDQNGEDIQKLEEKFRTLGIPYASEEPEPLYWANFRVRVMERIAEKERKANWPARFGQFIEEHVWGAGIAVSAACLLVAGILWLQPSSDAPPIAAVEPPVAAPAPIAPAERQPFENYATPGTAGSYKTHPSDRSYRSHEIVKLAKNQTEDLASAEEPLAATDQETPVSLQSLSQPELESVLQGLQTHE